MTGPDTEFDPDDNFANGFAPVAGDDDDDDEDEDTPEALVWHLLLLINPGDEEAALQQFSAYREACADGTPDEVALPWRLQQAIDWKSGFHVDAGDAAAFIDSVTELAARWNLRLDWGADDPGDDDFLAGTDVPALMELAYDRLREDGYTLWTWNTADATAAGVEAHAGWIALSRDDDAMRVLALRLGIELRAGSDAF